MSICLKAYVMGGPIFMEKVPLTWLLGWKYHDSGISPGLCPMAKTP